ncbi:MAG TPA: F0F1 ATP synthase subunit delta [Candidatus Paceibacterota bacterium]|nr:F0F1 ATP synthase subunit delta [Candidatus Paceibacterota bacterium]
MLAKYYALALALAIAGKTGAELDATLERFFALLQGKGHVTLLPHILRETERYAQLMNARDSVTVTTPVPPSAPHIEEIQRSFAEYGVGERELVKELDTYLIGGFTIQTRDLRIDASYKRQLLELYQATLKR